MKIYINTPNSEQSVCRWMEYSELYAFLCGLRADTNFSGNIRYMCNDMVAWLPLISQITFNYYTPSKQDNSESKVSIVVEFKNLTSRYNGLNDPRLLRFMVPDTELTISVIEKYLTIATQEESTNDKLY